MAKPKYSEILEQGVKEWNKWRKENPVLMGMSSALINLTDFKPPRNRFQLPNANLTKVDLSGVELIHLNLDGADFSGSKLIDTNMYGSNLMRAHFERSNLLRANLQGTDLYKCTFRHSCLSQADLSFSKLGETVIIDSAINDCVGLDKCQHKYPNVIDIRTMLKSGGLPASFLRACGYPNSLIEHLGRFLVNFNYHTCFISYSDKDDEFVSKLYGNLTQENVQCCRYKEDSSGDLWAFINNEIKDKDRVILVCSKNSLESRPVMREVNRALRKTDSLKKQGLDIEVLIPITIDEYVHSEEWKNKYAADVKELTIIDFQDWTNSKSYKKAFDKLIKDLRAETQDQEPAKGLEPPTG